MRPTGSSTCSTKAGARRRMPDGSWRIVARERERTRSISCCARDKPPAIHGENGVSVKAEGVGLRVALLLDDAPRSRGHDERTALHAARPGWITSSAAPRCARTSRDGTGSPIQLDNDAELMLYIIRRTDGTPDVTSSGSLISSDGNVIHLRRDQMRDHADSAHGSRRRAARSIRWAGASRCRRCTSRSTLEPLLKDQELVTRGSTRVTYWEGAVDVERLVRRTRRCAARDTWR